MNMVPRSDLVSTGYCLASSQPGKAQFLVYIPQGNIVSVDLSGLPGAFLVEWFDPETGLSVSDSSRVGGADCRFHSPFQWESVLFLDRSSQRDRSLSESRVFPSTRRSSGSVLRRMFGSNIGLLVNNASREEGGKLLLRSQFCRDRSRITSGKGVAVPHP